MTLNQSAIESLKNDWLINPNTSIYDSYVPFYEPIRDYLRMLSDCKVIEIGPGKKPVSLEWPCKEYVGVQPEPVEINIANCAFVCEDALTFLRKQEDSTAVVISFGVLDYYVLCPIGRLHEQYKQELADEIKRVSDPFAIVIGDRVNDYLGKANLYTVPPHSLRDGGIYSFK